ncbi:MAG: hypothetical protein IGR93_17485 [Hydrococcus sp. C42_A2020_068]|uniref:hypothetical protein n=1 Tax=Pleurocapsa sp. PCC 7327 TaxID=118163 RepID=UPI00029F9DA4|nr:hypothetical protein [Pleurocapsa sp. PCC 7327]AFY75961.1 hypothetical protein Ple7327_0514 [Pleurocapsa sp. PCC 7327]MBF2021832.1 hypothetical protein [Hydrococcus sp. C42_A2020_068]
MNQAEIEAALKAAFLQCEQAFLPLTDRQKEILLKVTVEKLTTQPNIEDNPLDELTLEQRQTLLEFIQDRQRQNQDWKITLLNDWLNNRDSGAVQFIRDEYGFGWLSRVQPIHLAKYKQQLTDETLKVGDRIEVCNALWEWVQPEDSASYEWFPCQVIDISEVSDGDSSYTNCIVRFENGLEFEIQGIDRWNRNNWRFPEP